MFSWTPLRILGDVILAGFGAFCILGFFWEERPYTYWWNRSRWAAYVMALGWCVTLVFFFGRDLLQQIRRRGAGLESQR